MNYYAPKSLRETLELFHGTTGRVTVLAGGTDVLPRRNAAPERSGWFNGELVPEEETILFIGDLGWDYIREDKETKAIHIGACTTITEILKSDVIKDKLPVLIKAAAEMAGVTVRNTATIGGNVMNASPAADMIPPLMVMDAQAVLVSAGGERRVSLCEFFTAPGKTAADKGELLKELVVPVCEGKAEFIKFGRRKAETLSMVNGAGRLVMQGGKCVEARIVIGAVSATPLRLMEVEALLIGKELSQVSIGEAAEAAVRLADPIDDKRAAADYRRSLIKVLVARVLKAAAC